jgi:hypothetical protein
MNLEAEDLTDVVDKPEDQTIFERFREEKNEAIEGRTLGQRFAWIGPKLLKIQSNKALLERLKLEKLEGPEVELHEDTTSAHIQGEIDRAKSDLIRIVFDGGGNIPPGMLPRVVNLQNIVKSQEALLECWQEYRQGALRLLRDEENGKRRRQISDAESTVRNLETETAYHFKKTNKPEYPYYHWSCISPDDTDLFLDKVLGVQVKVGTEEWKAKIVRLAEIVDNGLQEETRQRRMQRKSVSNETSVVTPEPETETEHIQEIKSPEVGGLHGFVDPGPISTDTVEDDPTINQTTGREPRWTKNSR